MKNIKDRRYILLIIIALLLVLTILSTYAYFMSNNQVINALNVTTNIENNNGVFTAIGSDIELNVTRDAMSEAVNNNLATSANGTLNVEGALVNKKNISQDTINVNEGTSILLASGPTFQAEIAFHQSLL